MKKLLTVLPILLIVLVLAGCGASKSNNAKSSSSDTAKSSSQSKPTTPADISFTGNTLTTPDGTLTLTGTKIAPSGVQSNTGEKQDKNQFIVYFTFKNTTNKDVYPADLWDKYVSAKQSGKKLTTGNLAWNTAETEDNNLINRSVMPVKAGKSCKALGMFRYQQKNTKPIIFSFTASNHEVIHTISYKVK